MGLDYYDLTEDVRRYMVEEIEHDIKNGSLYFSNYLNETGFSSWPDYLIESAKAGSDDSLARMISINGCFKETVPRKKPSGGYSQVQVPYTAHETLSESQFNQYYMRALSRLALDNDIDQLEIYRAKQTGVPRPQSEALIGTYLHPQVVLDELRRTVGVEPDLGLPLPNSGLSLKLPR
ncbi:MULTISPECIES: hypothetical protein [unclassified Brevundimonas]|uniref:hypothetical protein n=1 Tax=unclassified Brevundimonas TaxID=2622653 RepID=UPI0025BCAFD5|nr:MULTISPECIES: hypothetical protein [unclassified Brevundimonas]